MAEFEFSAFIENLNSRTRGMISGAWLSFPTTKQLVQETLRLIGVDGLRNEEMIFTDFRITIPGLQPILGEYAHVDDLNYLAHRIKAMSPDDCAKFVAAVKHGEYADGLQDVINLTYNLDCYEWMPDITSYEDYGRHLVDCQRDFELPEQAKMYFDYAAYGEDTVINEGGDITSHGYICNNRSEFKDIYDGETVPEEYRVFEYPMQVRAKQSQQTRSEKHHGDPNR